MDALGGANPEASLAVFAEALNVKAEKHSAAKNLGVFSAPIAGDPAVFAPDPEGSILLSPETICAEWGWLLRVIGGYGKELISIEPSQTYIRSGPKVTVGGLFHCAETRLWQAVLDIPVAISIFRESRLWGQSQCWSDATEQKQHNNRVRGPSKKPPWRPVMKAAHPLAISHRRFQSPQVQFGLA
jgi:hypothetical protein